MERIVITEDNSIETTRMEPFELASPGQGQIAVRVNYSGLGMIDALQASGVIGNLAGHTPGLEVSGTVTAVGDGVDRFEVGDRVAGMCFGGGLASHALLDVNMSVKLPEGISDDVASVTIVNTLTAWAGLRAVQAAGKPTKALIFAAAGGLGTQFTQVLRTLGVHEVDGVVGSAEKEQLVKELGVKSVFRRDQNDSIPNGHYDLVVDPVGGEGFTAGWEALDSGGCLLKVGNASGASDVSIDPTRFWLENKTVMGFNVGAWMTAQPGLALEGIQWAVENVAVGNILVPTMSYPASEYKTALSALKNGQTSGKLTLKW